MNALVMLTSSLKGHCDVYPILFLVNYNYEMSKKCFLGFAIDILSCSILEIFKFLTLCTFDSKGFKSFPNEQILFSDEGEEIKTFSV